MVEPSYCPFLIWKRDETNDDYLLFFNDFLHLFVHIFSSCIEFPTVEKYDQYWVQHNLIDIFASYRSLDFSASESIFPSNDADSTVLIFFLEPICHDL